MADVDISADPVFYGAGDPSPAAAKSPSALEFLTRMIEINNCRGLVGAAAVNRTVRNLRGRAHQWWHLIVKNGAADVDKHLVTQDWDVFEQAFRAYTQTTVQESASAADLFRMKPTASDDIAAHLCNLAARCVNDYKPRYDHFERLFAEQTVANFAVDHGPAVAEIYTLMIDSEIILTNAARRRNMVTAVIRDALRWALNQMFNSFTYDLVTRAAIQTYTNKKVVEWLRKNAFLPDRTRNVITLGCDARAHEIAVSASDNRQQHINEVVDESKEEHVDAVRGKGKQRRGGRQGSSSSGKRPEDWECGFCNVDSHKIVECRRLRAHLGRQGLHLPPAPGSSGQQRGNRGRGRGQRGRGGPPSYFRQQRRPSQAPAEPMDLSAASQTAPYTQAEWDYDYQDYNHAQAEVDFDAAQDPYVSELADYYASGLTIEPTTTKKSSVNY